MKFGIGDTCYIIENDEVKRARVSAKKDGHRTPEEAEDGKQKTANRHSPVQYL